MSFRPFALKTGDRERDLNAIGVRVTVLASGSDIQDQQITEQSGAGQRAGSPLLGFAFAVTERAPAIVARDNGRGTQHTAIEVTAEVDQRVAAGAHCLAIDHLLARVEN